MVLLGIRTALKENLHCTTAELVYGTTLRLPGEFFVPAAAPSDPPSYVSTLKSSMQLLRATPPRPARRATYVSLALSSCTHVFIQHDATRKPLQQPYDGPYKVLKQDDKHFVFDINGRHDTVFLDRLKPAHSDDSPPCTPPVDTTPHTSPPTGAHSAQVPPTATQTTKSGCRVPMASSS